MIENHLSNGSRTLDRFSKHTVNDDPHYATGRTDSLIAEKLGSPFFDELLIERGNSRFITLPTLPRALTLFFKFALKPLHVELHGFLIGNLLCKVEGKAVGVIKLEDFSSGDQVLSGLRNLLDHLFKLLQPNSDHRREALFFRFNDACDILPGV